MYSIDQTDFVVRNTNPEADLRYWKSKGTQATYFSIQGDFDLYDKLFENLNIGEKSYVYS